MFTQFCFVFLFLCKILLKILFRRHLYDLCLHTGASVSAQANVSIAPEPPSQGSAAFTRGPLWSNQEVSKRDQETQIPVQFSTYDQPEFSRERFQVVNMETASHHLDRRSVTQARGEQDQDQDWNKSGHLQPAAQQSSHTLNQLWERFSAELRLEESGPTRDREVLLLESLERVFRQIQNMRGDNASEASHGPAEKLGRKGRDATGKERKKHTADVKTREGSSYSFTV